MADWDFWVHGINARVEKSISGMTARHVGWGTIVSQPANTSNWLHLAIPTPTQIAGDTGVVCTGFWFKAKLNQNARIIAVHLWANDVRVAKLEGLDLRGPLVDFDSTSAPVPPTASGSAIAGLFTGYKLRDSFGTGAGLVICVGVEFLSGTPVGEITLTGGAARFFR